MSANQETKIKKILNSLEVEIADSETDYKVKLKGLDGIRTFFQKEQDFWESLPRQSGLVSNYIQYWRNHLTQIQNFEDNLHTDEEQIKGQWQPIHNHLVNPITAQGEKIFYSKAPTAQFLYELYQNNNDEGEQAHKYLLGQPTNFSIESFRGWLRAYEFTGQGDSEIAKRRKVERKALASLRNEWEQKTQDLNNDFRSLQTEFGEWKEVSATDFDGWKTSTMEKLEKWIEEKTGDVVKFLNKHRDNFEKLHGSYSEKLRLEGPVRYWQDRAKKYLRQGIVWATLLFLVVMGTGYFLYSVLYNLPAAFRYALFQGHPEPIRGIIILATIISFAAYLIRVFSKLTFSSFHLQRDAEEREQLTMVFLALVKEGTIEKEERDLILQSLFSRADTGLLGGDSSPTMPINIIGKITGK